MITATNIWKILAAGIFLSTIGSSCSKNLPKCTGNCDLITFSGNVSEFTSGQPVSGQTIKVILKQNSCPSCSTNVAEGSSDAGGHFELKKEIDTSWLRDHYLEVELTTTDGYITRVAPADLTVGYLYPRSKEFYFVHIDSSLTAIQFKIFTKTSLRINLHRNTTIVAGREYLDLQYRMTGDESAGLGEGFVMSDANKDTAVYVNTAANVFTKISVDKFIGYDSSINKTDSVKCSTNARNSIDISY